MPPHVLTNFLLAAILLVLLVVAVADNITF
jgi:hypothetical protein